MKMFFGLTGTTRARYVGPNDSAHGQIALVRKDGEKDGNVLALFEDRNVWFKGAALGINWFEWNSFPAEQWEALS